MSHHPDGARFLMDTGLLAEINRTILHPLGLALFVESNEDAAAAPYRFGGICDVRAEDAEGILFSEESLVEAHARLVRFMTQEGKALHEARQAALGFVVQPLPPEQAR